jgi:hypothetical protein
MPETTGISPVFSVNSTMLDISGQKSESSPIKPDRRRVTSQSLYSALTVFKGQQLTGPLTKVNASPRAPTKPTTPENAPARSTRTSCGPPVTPRRATAAVIFRLRRRSCVAR